MARPVKIKLNKKVYVAINDRKPLAEAELFTEEFQDMVFAYEKKNQINHYNRSIAQKKRRERIRILKQIEQIKALGIPFKKESLMQQEIQIDEKIMKYYGIEFEE